MRKEITEAKENLYTSGEDITIRIIPAEKAEKNNTRAAR